MHLGLNEEELERCATLIDRNDTHTFDFSEFLAFVDSYQPLDSYGTEDPPWKGRPRRGRAVSNYVWYLIC